MSSRSSNSKSPKIRKSQVVDNLGLFTSDITPKQDSSSDQGEESAAAGEDSSSVEKSSPCLKSFDFRPGDTVRVHARIVEGNKERIQVFEGVVIKRHKRNQRSATFTVRKISYSVGVERTFLLHSPRIEKIEIVSRGIVRRARLFYLRDTVGKSGRIKTDRSASTDLDATDINENPGNGKESGPSNGSSNKATRKASSGEAQPVAA